ncbi:MAG: hypothetical protein KKD44_26600 [Proteobacteria bacterium]|nr:hypothetical protein [Pseudomonadota bacterium]
MSLLIPGRIADLVLFLIFCGTILVLTLQASGGKKFELKRKLAALDAMPEAIGRAVEMGRPVHYTPGGNPLYGVRGTHIQMGLVISGYVARLCARLGSKLIISVATAEQIPLAEEIYRGAYIAEKVPLAQPDVRFYGKGDPPFGAGCIETIYKERVAVNMIIGGSGSDFPIIAEGAFRAGAFQIGGNANVFMIPLVVASCEYTLIGEELFAAGAMLSEDPSQLAGIVANDLSKLFIIAMILLGVVLMTAGNSTVLQLLKI